ncbi:MAG: hypothetical protein ACOCQN_02755 [Halanaerobiaceae bacterium]
MSIFEAVMLISFGSAWPVSIYKSYISRTNSGKSLGFLLIIFAGYLSGITHKIFYSQDSVIYLYMLNALMVLIDVMLYFRNMRYDRERS